jgi:integral membrane protein (TIGR01906 family)
MESTATKRIFGITARWLFILCLPTLLLTASIGIAVNSQWLYEYGFDKYNVGGTTGLADNELEKAAGGLIAYFNSSEDIVDITVIKDGQSFTLFNQKEVAHLRDVKGLIRLDYWVLLGSGIYVLIFTVISLGWLAVESRRRLASATIYGSGLTFGLMLLLGLLALLDFDRFFLQFHLISFANDLWQLDPAKDFLIMLFPQGFWYDATIFSVVFIVAMAAILSMAAGGYLLVIRRREIL